MKKSLKVIGSMLLSLCMLTQSNVVSADQYDNKSFYKISFVGQTYYSCEQDYFERVDSDKYSNYSFTPNHGTSLRVKLYVVDYESYKFVPTSLLRVYEVGSNRLMGSVSFKSTIGEHYFTFDNLFKYGNYYINLNSGPNCNVSAVLFVSSDGTY